jgi:hypothetical protein
MMPDDRSGRASSRDEMTATDVVAFLDLASGAGSGSGSTAAGPSMPASGAGPCRSDLDIVVEERQLASLAGARRSRLPAQPRDDTRAWNFVLGDDEGHEIDFHVIVSTPRARPPWSSGPGGSGTSARRWPDRGDLRSPGRYHAARLVRWHTAG